MDYDLKFPLLRECDNPHQREANCLKAHNAPFFVVGPQSPPSWRKAIAQMASYFKREFGFDLNPYSDQEADAFETQMDRVLVFHGSQVVDRKPTRQNPRDFTSYLVFFGCIGIRRRFEKDSSYWAIAWVWLHPYERRRGHMTAAWPFILKMFPNPYPEPPVSLAMEGFLKKVEHTFKENASERLIFDLAYLRIRKQHECFEAAKREKREAEVPVLESVLKMAWMRNQARRRS